MNTKTKKSKLTDTLKLKIRNEFVQGINESNEHKVYTLDELIKKYNVAQSTIYRIARNEQWKIQRDQFQQEYTEKLDRDRIKNRAKESIRLDDNSITLAKALYTTVGIVMQNNNLDMQQGKKGLPPSQLNSLANAAITAQRLAKLALGEATLNIDATVNENTDAFRRAMELLDTVEDQRRSQGDGATH
tara:strand:+ start:11275 stop:11838 length:564 start_codon:yes stop_codon:yes gene_type:complete